MVEWGGTKSYYASQDVLIVQHALPDQNYRSETLEKCSSGIKEEIKHKGGNSTRTVKSPQQCSFPVCVHLLDS